MKRRTRRILLNPLVLISPIMLIIYLGWQTYSVAGRHLSAPVTGQNLLDDKAWRAGDSGQLRYTFFQNDAFLIGPSYKLVVLAYRSGEASLTSPGVKVHAGTRYLFKSYYESSLPVTLLAHIWYQNRTDRLVQLAEYPAAPSDATASYAFETKNEIASVQFVFHVAGNGSLTISNPYLEPNSDVALASTYKPTPNLVPNPDLAPDQFEVPDQWSTYRTGDSSTTFSYLNDSAGPYLAVNVQDYKSGQAKWQYPAQPVTAFANYTFSVDYRATVPSQILAEYDLADGSKKFVALGSLAPTESWTTTTASFQAPAGAADLFVSVILAQNGTLATRHYNLAVAEARQDWPAPVVSITFDDGTAADNQIAASLLSKYKLNATFYVNPATIETPGHMSASNLASLYGNGNEIASAGYYLEDLTAVNVARLNYNLARGRSYLSQAGFKPSDLAPPYGKTDAQVSWYARKYYLTLRTTEPGINTSSNFNPYNLLVMPVSPDTTPDQIKAALNQARQANGWLILAYTQVDNDLSGHLAAVKASGIAVDTVAKAADALKKPMPAPLPLLTVK